MTTRGPTSHSSRGSAAFRPTSARRRRSRATIPVSGSGTPDPEVSARAGARAATGVRHVDGSNRGSRHGPPIASLPFSFPNAIASPARSSNASAIRSDDSRIARFRAKRPRPWFRTQQPHLDPKRRPPAAAWNAGRANRMRKRKARRGDTKDWCRRDIPRWRSPRQRELPRPAQRAPGGNPLAPAAPMANVGHPDRPGGA